MPFTKQKNYNANLLKYNSQEEKGNTHCRSHFSETVSLNVYVIQEEEEQNGATWVEDMRLKRERRKMIMFTCTVENLESLEIHIQPQILGTNIWASFDDFSKTLKIITFSKLFLKQHLHSKRISEV